MPEFNTEALERRLKKEQAAAKDEVLGGDPEKELTPQQEDQQEIQLLEAEKENARLRERLAELEQERQREESLRRHWVEGDFSDLPPDHPFEIVVQTDSSGLEQKPIVEPEINGKKYTIVRGIPTRVPHEVVQHLSHLKYDYTVKEIGPNGYPLAVTYKAHRFPFSAHPLYT